MNRHSHYRRKTDDDSDRPQHTPRPFFATPCHDMGIDALERLIKQIAADVQNLASTPPQQGRYLLQSLQVAFTRGLAFIAGFENTVAPINRIPPELLTRIFALSSRTVLARTRGLEVPCPFDEVDVPGDLHKLPKVCRYWRDVALATPTLWATISTHTFRTIHRDERSWFRRSVYLPDDSSVGLVVHFDALERVSKHCGEKMTEFMVTNSPRFRELHVWRASAIQDFPLFLRSIDASTLEHCTLTLWDDAWSKPTPSPGIRVLPFFCKGGDRLRSLSLSGADTLPCNEFPALTLLWITVASRVSCPWDVSDLIRFFAGSPRLEEVYVYDVKSPPLNPSTSSPPGSPAPNTPIALPHLRYLAFKCNIFRNRNPKSDFARVDPVEYLLSRVSIPSTCHMHFVVNGGDNANRIVNRAILDSVRRHVCGKATVSHLFLGLSLEDINVQLVFSEGSLCLKQRTSSLWGPTEFEDCVAGFFRSFPGLFARTEELRIAYSYDDSSNLHDQVSSLASKESFPAIFPNIRALSLIPDFKTDRDTAAIDIVHRYLAQPFESASPSDGRPDALAMADLRVPYPSLNTLWTSVRSREDITYLKATLAARASLGCPIRHLIVMLRDAHVKDADDAAAQLRALDVEEIVLMHVRNNAWRRNIDWLVTLPEMHSLPSTIHRDWPTMWH